MRGRAAAVVLALAALPFSVAGCLGCPAALVVGVLVRDGTTLVVDMGDFPDMRIKWPFGYGVREEAGRLVVTDIFGSIKAREGDTVHLGGGMVGPDEQAFGVCGDFKVDRA